MERSWGWIASLCCCCATAPALANCSHTAWMCATPGAAYAGKNDNPVAPQQTLVLQYGAFALEKVETPGALDRFDLRPSWRLSDDARLSLKVNKHQTELRLNWQW